VAPGPKYPYAFAVADYREINAFALPGGPVWINRGALQMATDESQVAGVLAHEIAHIAQRHAADQLTKTMIARWGIGLLGGLLGNVGGASAAQVAAGLLANGAFLQFSRDDERDADRVGLQILTRAGWDGRGMIELLEILGRQRRRDPGAVEVFLSTHPSPQERIRELQAAVAARHGGRRDSAQFTAIKARLTRMPAAPPMPRR
jgi:predicted Zn-dependent protease